MISRPLLTSYDITRITTPSSEEEPSSLFRELKQTMNHYKPLANNALLSYSLSSVIDFPLLFNYLLGYREVGKVYETILIRYSLADPSLQLILKLGYCVIEVQLPEPIRCDGFIQFWYYDLSGNTDVLDETNEVRTDNERFKDAHLFSDSDNEDEDSEPVDVVSFIMCIQKDPTVQGGEIELNDEIGAMNHGVFHVIKGNIPYRFAPRKGTGTHMFIRVMYPVSRRGKDE